MPNTKKSSQRSAPSTVSSGYSLAGVHSHDAASPAEANMLTESLPYPPDAASKAGSQHSTSSKMSHTPKGQTTNKGHRYSTEDASKSQYHTDSKNSFEQYPPDVSSKESSQYNKSSNLSFDEAHHSPNHNVVSEKLGRGSESKSGSIGYKALPPPPYTPIDFMPRPVIPGCPTGLEYLVTVDQLLISRSVQRYKEHINMFQVKNSLGQPVYFAQEETNPREQQCCPKKRGFKMHLTDNYGNEVIRAVRDFRCCAGCCWCACLDCGAYEMTVQSPAGNDIGYVRQACSWMTNDFEVLDADRQHVLTIKGPAICLRPMPGMNVESQVQSLEGSTLGSITRLAFGPFRDARPYSDELSVTFPLDMDVHMKACLLTAAFFLNLIFFERFVYIQ